MTRSHRVAVIPGDGIGPEVVRGALDVLRAVAEQEPFGLDVVEVSAGAGDYLATGRPLSDEAWDLLKSGVDGTLKGPVGLPEVRHPDGTEAGLLGGVLRRGLDLYANVRPVRLFPGVRSALRDPGAVDYVIVRENTEGLYASRDGGIRTSSVAADTMLMTRAGVARIARYAFELARARRRDGRVAEPRLTCVDKANVLRSFAFFREVVAEVGAEYPDVRLDHLHADAAAAALVTAPDSFDVLVTENFLGDVLSDLGGATIGGLGVCYSGNIGDQHAYFEPCHGSAPALAGKGLANPVGQVLAGAELLDHLGERPAANRVRAGVERALDGLVDIAADGSVSAGTAAATAAVIASLPAS